MDRKAALMSSNDYHNFMLMVRDLLALSSGLRRSLITQKKVSDAAFRLSEVVALGEDMVAEEHSALGLLFFLVWSYNIMVCVAMKRMIAIYF